MKSHGSFWMSAVAAEWMEVQSAMILSSDCMRGSFSALSRSSRLMSFEAGQEGAQLHLGQFGGVEAELRRGISPTAPDGWCRA